MLHCAACGGPLGDAPQTGRTRPKKDAFRGRVVGGARLRKLLAVRPTAVVFQAMHKQLGTDVRVEIFLAGFADEHPAYMQRLFRRAALTRETRSAHVVSVLDLGRRPDCWYILTEYLPDSLRSLLERKGSLPLDRALAIAEDVLLGLAAVDALGAVHGNVSPEGVLLAPDGSAKLDHLGTAPRPREMHRLIVTAGGMVAGPALYVAPERAADERRADIRSDLYSLGATMCEMLGGWPPYDGCTAQEITLRHVESPVPDLGDVRPELPVQVCRFVQRLLSKDPDDRPAGPEAALNELRECAAQLSSQAGHRKPSPQGGAESVEVVATPSRPVATRRSSLQAGGLRALRWPAIWTVLAVSLMVLAVVPPVVMYRQRARKRAALRQAEAEGPHKVLVLVQDADPTRRDPLPAQEALAVRVLLSYALAYWPELDPVDPFYVEELREAGKTAEQILEICDPRHVLVAAYAAGFRRRNWTLRVAGDGRRPWAVQTTCSLEDEPRNGLAELERALHELLKRAAEPLNLEPVEGDRVLIAADRAGWVEMSRALQAEREGRWDEAVSRGRRAAQMAPGAAPFALLSAFFSTVARLQGAAEPSAQLAELPRENLPPEMAALAGVLEAVAQSDRPLVKVRFGDYLAGFPRSGRGYFLLGEWLLHGEGKPDEAAVALEHAVELDPRYMPAAYGCVELLARRDAEEVRAFLERYKERVPNEERANRLERYAERFLRAGEGGSAEPLGPSAGLGTGDSTGHRQ